MINVEVVIEGPDRILNRLSKKLADLPLQMDQFLSAGLKKPYLVMTINRACADVDALLAIVSQRLQQMEAQWKGSFPVNITTRDCRYGELPFNRSKTEKPFEAAPGCYIQPWGTSFPAAQAGISIVIDPQDAFGNGKHPTTQLCLALIKKLVVDDNLAAPMMLDVGCGTGILAIAAVKMGACQATGVDIHTEVIQAARKNAELNGLSNAIQLISGPVEAIRAKFDLVLANVVPSVFCRMGPALTSLVARGGFIILSGFRNSQSEAMQFFLKHQGFGIKTKQSRQGWAAISAQYQP